jgi:protein SCO1/2
MHRRATRTHAAGMLLAMSVAALAGTAITGCSKQGDASGGASAGASASDGHVSVADYHGAVLGTPLDKPDFTLTDTRGQPFDFRKATDGYVTFLYFGYTNCPDVCPVHMANIAAALKQVPPDVRDRVKVVFVTTDPERDTPQRLRSWLDNFDSTFVGLRGDMKEVNQVQAKLNLEPATKEAGAGKDYGVGHSALVIAFSLDNKVHVVYPFGVQRADWAHDIPLLVRDSAKAG